MQESNDVCPTCGGSIVGDGYTTVRHCEHVDVPLWIEPDSDTIYCLILKEDPPSYIPKEKHGEFDVMAQGEWDFTLKAFPICGSDGMMMVIGTSEGAVYVTKEQAMAFYGLVDPDVAAAPKADDELPTLYDLFPYEYQGGGYFRERGVPIKISAPILHGEQAVQYVYDKIKALP